MQNAFCIPQSAGLTQLLRVMRITAFIMLIFATHLSAKTVSQTVSFKGTNVPFAKVVAVIKQQTSFAVAYNPDIIAKANPVTIDAKDTPLKDFLYQITSNQPFGFLLEGNTIFITPKSENVGLNARGNLSLPPFPISGRVTNADGNPLSGASVTNKNSKVSVATDADGRFSINSNEGEVLVITFVGYGKLEIKITSTTSALVLSSDQEDDLSETDKLNSLHKGQTLPFSSGLNIVLSQKISNLDQIQIIAYGTTTKRFATGNVSSIKSEEIEKQTVNNPILALQGRVPGIIISQNTGMPGGSINIQIRGRNSIGSKNDPLYIIDGVPYSSQHLPNLGSGVLQQSNSDYSIGAGNPLSIINPSDIESISVLKDADATAIYGSRGANGVVLITTKRGRVAKTGIELNASTGLGKAPRNLKLLNTQQYIEARKEAFNNDSEPYDSTNAPDLLIWDSTKYTDWQKELIGRTANFTNFQASISGGSNNLQFLIKGNYYKETTVFPGNFDDKKGSVHFNINSTSQNQKFRTTLSGIYLVDNNNLPTTDFSSFVNTPPNAPDPYNPDGSLNWAQSSWPSGNPLSYAKDIYKVRTDNLVGNLKLSYQLAKGLEVSGNAGYTNMQVNEIFTNSIAANDPAWGIKTGGASFTNNNIRSWILEPQLNYDVTISQGKLVALFGGTFQNNVSNGQIIDVSGYTSDVLLQNIQAGPTRSIRPVTYGLYKYNAGFTRLNYSWRSKYILNLNGRRDGSSRFGQNNRFHNFGSVGLAWIFSEETFIKKALPFLSFGKVRSSYGTTGNDQIGNYRYYGLFSSTQYPYQNTTGFVPAGLNNPDLQWEITKKFEVSTDLGLVKDRILLNASYYFNKSSNQLVNYLLPVTSGFSSISVNFPATVQNRGWEFSINSINVKTNSFTWNSYFNFTLPRNKLASFPNIENTSYKSLYVVGEPLTLRRVYHAAGVNDSTGTYQFVDSKGFLTDAPDPQTDQTAVVNTSPKYYGGIGNTLTYKGLQLDFLFQFTKQMGKDYFFQGWGPLGTFGLNTIETAMLRWQKPGDHGLYSSSSQNYVSSSYQTFQYAASSDLAYTDASFVRLKNLSISYHFQESLISKMHVQSCKIYLLAQNIFTITNYKGTDPESQNISALPPLRIITAGIAVTF
jgi:TonB-linked SusC/RagA family outer membrane protein